MTTEQTWVARVRDWKASGQSAPAFAAGKDFAPSTLTWWAYRLRKKEAAAVPVALPQTPLAVAVPSVRMARVGTAATSFPEALVVEVAGARILLRPGFDHTLLQQAVRALVGAR